MTRIEKTQINISAFIVLKGTLQDVQSDKVVEIVNDGRTVILRDKHEDEKEDFNLDLTFLDELMKHMLQGGPTSLTLRGEAEQYLRNCSYAAYYYRNENKRHGIYDHFDLFHEIHFKDLKEINIAEDIICKFCYLFRIDPEIIKPFNNCTEYDKSSYLSPYKENKAFNDIFPVMKILKEGIRLSITFESEVLDIRKSLDALFTIKDLLSCRGIDISNIPEYASFGIQQDEVVSYKYAVNDIEVLINFSYKLITVTFSKDC